MTVIYLPSARRARAPRPPWDPDQIAAWLLTLVAAYGTCDCDDNRTQACRFHDLLVDATWTAAREWVVTVSSDGEHGHVDLFCAGVALDGPSRSVSIGYCEPGDWLSRLATAFAAYPVVPWITESTGAAS